MTQKMPGATERQNPRTRGLDAKFTPEILRAIVREEASVAGVVAGAIPAIARAVDAIAQVLQRGGRLFYVGAGTSGRLAVLDAAELPPTFGIPARMVQAVMAGGRSAITRAIEGTEDNHAQGGRDLAARRLTRNDAVVAISASGSTPYVLGALEFARRRGALTVCITANPRAPIVRPARIRIITPTGPEAIAGSTRMKAGTAQKMVLNMLSTATMVRMGRVYSNWMLGQALTNRKLRARGLRILAEASGATRAEAARALRKSPTDLGVAFLMLRTGAGAQEAQRRLRAAHGNIRAALQGKTTATRAAKRPHG